VEEFLGKIHTHVSRFCRYFLISSTLDLGGNRECCWVLWPEAGQREDSDGHLRVNNRVLDEIATCEEYLY